MLKTLSQVYFIGAEAVVTVILKDPTKSDHYPSELNLIYNIIEIYNTKLPAVASDSSDSTYSAKTVVIFMLLPFALAGLALYLALKFCLNKYRGMAPDDFAEEPVGESEQAVNYGEPGDGGKKIS